MIPGYIRAASKEVSVSIIVLSSPKEKPLVETDDHVIRSEGNDADKT